MSKYGDKRTKQQRQAHVLELLEMAIIGVPSGERTRRINRRFKEEIRAGAIEAEYPPETVQRLYDEASLTRVTVNRDLRKAMEALRAGSQQAGEMLLHQRIQGLEEELLHVNLVAQAAWRAWEASCQKEVTVTTTRGEVASEEPVDAAPDPTADPLLPRRPGRPRRNGQQARASVNRVAEARFLEIALRCVEQRVVISGQIFQLAAQIGLQSVAPAELAAARSSAGDALQALLLNELEPHYLSMSRLTGVDVEERRMQILAALAKLRGQVQPRAPQTPAAQVWTFGVREITDGRSS